MGEFARSNIINVPLFDMSLGVFYDRHPVNIPVGGCSQVRNMVWSDGYVCARPGLYKPYGMAVNSNPVVHLSRYVPLVGETRLIRVSRDLAVPTTMHVHQYAGGVWTAITSPGGIAGALDPNSPPQSVNFGNRWYLAPGNTGLYVFNGTTLVTLSSLISNANQRPWDAPKFLAATESRLIIANTLDSTSGGNRAPFRVAWCDRNQPLIWSTGSADGNGSSRFIDLPSDSSPITGLFCGPNSTITVFKSREVIIGEPAASPYFFEFKLLQKGPGCISAKTIKEWRDGKVIMLGDDNVYVYVPGQTPQPAGDAIRPRFFDLANIIQLDRSCAFIDRDNDLYTLIVPESTGPTAGKNLRMFTLSLRNGSWWEGVYNLGTDASADEILDAFEFRFGTWQSKVLLGSAKGNIFESSFTVTSDDNNIFDTIWVSGVIRIPQLTNNKTQQGSLQIMRVYADNGQVSCGCFWGDNLDRFSFSDFGIQQIDGVSQPYVSGREIAENFKFTLGTSNAVNSPKITGMAIGFIPEGNTR